MAATVTPLNQSRGPWPTQQPGPRDARLDRYAAAEAVIETLPETALKDLAELYSTEILAHKEARSAQVSDWQRWIDAYKGRPATTTKTYPWQGASNLVIGLAAIYVDSVVARIMSGLFSYEPFWTITQLSEQTAQAAKPLERYLEMARTRIWDQYAVVKPAVLELCKLGTMVLYSGWKDEVYYQAPFIGAPSAPVGRCTGPHPTWVPREDFLLPEGYSAITTAPWCSHTQWFSWVDLQRFAMRGFFTNIEELTGRSDESTELRAARQQQQQVPQTAPGFGQWMCEQVWFAHDFDNDGYPEEYTMVLHPKSKTILRIRPNPYPYGMRPYVKASFIEQEGQFDGIGIPEMVEMYQHEVSTIHNQRRDNAHIANTVMLKTNKTLGYTDNEPIFPGKLWQVLNADDVMPVVFGQSYMSTIADEQLTISLAEKRVGITDSNLGRENSATGRAAATTVLALLQEGTRRFDLNTSELRRCLSEQGMQLCELWQTHGLPEPGGAYAPEGLLSPEESMLLRQVMQADGIRGILTLNVNVATAAVNQEMEKQAMLQINEVVNEYMNKVMESVPLLLNPQVPPEVKGMVLRAIEVKDTMTRSVLQAFHRLDLESILMGEALQQLTQTALENPAIGMQPQGSPPAVGGPPPGPPQAAGGPPPGPPQGPPPGPPPGGPPQ